MSRSAVVTLVAVLVFAGLWHRAVTWQKPLIPPTVQPIAGQQCMAAGGVQSYCRCLDRMESARAAAEIPVPRLNVPRERVLREALKRPDHFPILNADSEHCILDPGPSPRSIPSPLPSPAPRAPAPEPGVTRA